LRIAAQVLFLWHGGFANRLLTNLPHRRPEAMGRGFIWVHNGVSLSLGFASINE
jgi:hypothetical protein